MISYRFKAAKAIAKKITLLFIYPTFPSFKAFLLPHIYTYQLYTYIRPIYYIPELSFIIIITITIPKHLKPSIWCHHNYISFSLPP